MPSHIDPISIYIEPREGGRYKSIQTLSWTDIPGFAILTGKNGSGKTQILELLAYHFTGGRPEGVSPHLSLPVEIRVLGVSYSPNEIAFVPSYGRFSGGQPASVATMRNFRAQSLHSVRTLGQTPHDVWSISKGYRLQQRLKGRNADSIDENIFGEITEYKDFLTDDIDVTTNLAYVFISYWFRMLEASSRGTPGVDGKGKSLGRAPWDVLNDAFAVAGFPYDVISPVEGKIDQDYTIRLRDRLLGSEIDARDLSSGERIIMQLVLWLYSAEETENFVKLLLLDEPDAHLHPSMTTQFLEVISQVLVGQHGVRVIMTTHSPSTVALAPEGSIYQLERGASAVMKVDQRPEAISVLTAGLVTVSRTTKFCFVEDEADVDFYKAVTEILMDHGPSRDPCALRPAPSIAFIPASIGNGRDKTSGGKNATRKWVEKLDDDPLDRMFLGIIDRDVANVASNRVHVIGRYSFENYLLDPLNLFCLLLEQGIAPAIPGVKVSAGDEHTLRRLSDSELQAIADVIAATMEAHAPQIKTAATTPVTYTVGKKITVPSWVIDYRGHDLLPIAQKAFTATSHVNPHRLMKAMRRCRLIPVELATLLANVQSA